MPTKEKILIIFILFSLTNLSCENFILGPDPENNAVNNFDILWKQFDLYYPSFQVKNINWDSLYNVYRNKISIDTPEDSLWLVISEMLYNLDDIHVFMYNRNNSKLFDASHNFRLREREFELDLIENIYLQGSFKTAGNGNFVYKTNLRDSIGYLYIKSFDMLSSDAQYIDKVLSELSNVTTLIIDLRNNRGGTLEIYRYIASSFVNKHIDYLQEIARNGPHHGDFTSPALISIDQRILNQSFNKKTILLTNTHSSSASELFCQLFKYIPNSEQIGDSTAGGLGASTRVFQLLNGWTYHMPAALSFTLEGKCLENIGVIPDIYVRNTEFEIDKGYDHIFEFTLDYLSKNHSIEQIHKDKDVFHNLDF